MKHLLATTVALAATVVFAPTADPYPLDADNAGIGRLEGSRPEVEARGRPNLPSGALLNTSEIDLSLAWTAARDWNFDTPENAELKAGLESMFARRNRSYGITVIDITDPDNIAWAGLREDRSQIPGSVGKVTTMLGFFNALADAFPNTADRERILREHVITAGEWVKWDSHGVKRYDREANRLQSFKIRPGDTYTLAEWMDHMISASANAAAATIWKETVLVRHFGSAYPPSPEAEAEFFESTPKRDLWEIASSAISEPMLAAELDPEVFWIGNLWTRTAKSLIPGNGGSRGTPHEMAKFLLRLEQGRLVDAWSSLEMKRYLYTTSRRYRYVYPPELHPAAVYFKSGSLYSCREEAGFSCGKYKGNARNFMNSLTIVESPARPAPGQTQNRYIVALTSNVLKVNSAWDHSRIGAAVEELINTRAAVTLSDDAKAEYVRGAEG